MMQEFKACGHFAEEWVARVRRVDGGTHRIHNFGNIAGHWAKVGPATEHRFTCRHGFVMAASHTTDHERERSAALFHWIVISGLIVSRFEIDQRINDDGKLFYCADSIQFARLPACARRTWPPWYSDLPVKSPRMTDGDFVICWLQDDRAICCNSSPDQVEGPVPRMLFIHNAFDNNITTNRHATIDFGAKWIAGPFVLRFDGHSIYVAIQN